MNQSPIQTRNLIAANEKRIRQAHEYAKSIKWLLVELHVNQSLNPTAIAEYMERHNFTPSGRGKSANGRVHPKQVRRLLSLLGIQRLPAQISRS